jgi:hypothetical protein
MEILDEEKSVLLSLMTFIRPEEGYYIIVLRVQADDAGIIAKKLKAAGFTVAYVG